MLAILLAAMTALVWGTADYCGGRASRRGNALGVTVVSQLFSVPVLVICLALVPATVYATDLAWGAGAGVAGLLGLVLLYRGLATGAMAVVAPITAVTSALVPMVVGLVVERLPSALAFGGGTCAILAVALVSLGSTGPTAQASARVVGLALSSGAMFGVFFVLLSRVHDESGMWPLVGVRFASVGLGLLLVARRGTSLRIPRALIGWTAVAGVGDVAANALFILAARDGLLSVVGPISALYPVSTVLLALVVDKERVRPVQVAGLGLAAAALVLTAV
jgi:drug/metabolite transporter (DMT)-like permease